MALAPRGVRTRTPAQEAGKAVALDSAPLGHEEDGAAKPPLPNSIKSKDLFSGSTEAPRSQML